MLFGSRTGKTSASNTILGQTATESEAVDKCVKREGVVCGRRVTLVEMPELNNTTLSQKDVLHEAYSALSLCSFNIHTFLMVLPVNPLTDDDKGELGVISDIFGTVDGKFWDHLMILYIWEGNRKDEVITNFIHGNRDIQDIVQKCGNKYHILSINQEPESEQLSELLKKTNMHTCYSYDTFVEAQLEKRIQLNTRNKEIERELKKIRQTGKTFHLI